jgi:hypothetical protein
MPNLKVPEIQVTQAVLRLASVQQTLPDEVVLDIQLLVDAIDERTSKLYQIAADARSKAFRDDISGMFVNANRIIHTLEREEK